MGTCPADSLPHGPSAPRDFPMLSFVKTDVFLAQSVARTSHAPLAGAASRPMSARERYLQQAAERCGVPRKRSRETGNAYTLPFSQHEHARSHLRP